MNLLSSSGYWRWMITVVIILLIKTSSFCSAAGPRTYESAPVICGENRTALIIPIFTRALEIVSQEVADQNWGSNSINSTNISIYALAQCYEDLPSSDCLLCYAASRTKLPRCLPATSGRIFLDGCFIRFDIYNFLSESVNSDLDKANCTASPEAAGVKIPANFSASAASLVDAVTGSAAARGGFATASGNGVYGLAQCWKTVSGDGCRRCLAEASREVKRCLPNFEGRALNTGCYLRYSAVNFIADPNGGGGGGSVVSKKGVKVAIALSVIAFITIIAFVAYTLRIRTLKQKREWVNLGAVSAYNRSKLNFKYETLEKATNYFEPALKLGEGGAGSVYKGKLTNGRVVAVKRLFFNTRQWVDEFFNEVNLVSGIEHKNLVKLLGCSIEGPESLLVYEYVINGSLDRCLFGQNKTKILSWRERFNIVVGTAEGIAFLHGGTETRIIHRDIKSGNVLLNENFEPRIADFGLARCFSPDQSHLSTGIAGTLGYMAPEYLVKGQLTEKADVYSFGVLVLEIVSGRRSNGFSDDSSSLLQTVWRHYTSGQSTELIDPSIRSDFHANEASKVVKIGLLCCQAVAYRRPSMSEVVQMLITEDCEIPEPTQPPFINSSLLTGNGSMSSIKTLVSKALKKCEGSSYTSSTDQSTSVQSSDGLQSDEFRNQSSVVQSSSDGLQSKEFRHHQGS